MIKIKLQPEHMALCENHAREMMKNRSRISRSVSWRGGERDSLEVQVNGKACEWATAVCFGLDPRRVLNWDTRCGDETDLQAAGKNIDVKGSQNPKAVLLIYSREITQWYEKKRFDTLLFARACPLPTVQLVGWISKAEFLQLHDEAPHGAYGPKLDPGTWYMHMQALRTVESLLPNQEGNDQWDSKK